MNRAEALKNIQENPQVDVLVVGGGINGIGTFRDLALQNVRVLLVERADFCSGASAASSHMVHGGIRYLENGEFRLVREAVKERNLLLQNAPHYVHPLQTTIPIFSRFSGILNAPLKFLGLLDKPAERGGLVIKLGLMMYDAYTGAKASVPKHRFENRQKSLARTPALNKDVLYTATYYDAAMHTPERIAMEVLLDGLATSPNAIAINYMSAVAASSSANGSVPKGSVLLRDETNSETTAVQPKLIINAAGPWIDFANDALGRQTNLIGGTKGSHLVLNHPELRAAIGESEFFFENEDGRIVLIYPFRDRVLIGTSDIPIDDPDDARCTDEEIDYFLDMVDVVFPSIEVDRSQIVFRFSGVRPLPASDAENAGQISRDHSIRVVEPKNSDEAPILNLIGGKWTTFRAFAEKSTDEALVLLGIDRQASTELLPIGGGRDYPQSADKQREWLRNLEEEVELPSQLIHELFDRYGTRAAEVARFISSEEDKESGSPAVTETVAGSKYYRGEIQFLLTHELVQHLDDLILRRSLMGMQGELTMPLLEALADIGQQTLGWSATERQAELKRTQAILLDQHGVALV